MNITEKYLDALKSLDDCKKKRGQRTIVSNIRVNCSLTPIVYAGR